MHRNRLLAAILLMVLLCAALTGCGTGAAGRIAPTAESPQTDTTIAAPATVPAAPTAEPTTATLPAVPTAESEPVPTAETVTEPATVPAAEVPALTEESAPEPTQPPEAVPASEQEETEAPDRSVPDKSSEETEAAPETEPTVTYIANKNSKKFHYPSCSSVSDMKEENKWYFTGTRDELIELGYVPCKRCKP